MTKDEAIDELKNCQENGDTEKDHVVADDVLCKLLRTLGHGDVVDEYEKIGKWYS